MIFTEYEFKEFYKVLEKHDLKITDSTDDFYTFADTFRNAVFTIEETKGTKIIRWNQTQDYKVLDNYTNKASVIDSFIYDCLNYLTNIEKQYKNVRIHKGTELKPIPAWKESESAPETLKLTDTQQKIKRLCDSISDLLIYKNQKYGNSAISPLKLFSKLDNINSIKIRLDDKLMRIKNSQDTRTNDITDIIGYLILLLIAKDVKTEEIEKLKD